MGEHRTEVLVVGGGMGGVAAALAAAERDVDVVLAEETHWLGGQLTSQAVPPDEHPWIERFGCTARYRRLRDGIRAYYRAHYPMTAAARARRFLNPGASRVSALAHEPRVALAVLEAKLAPHRSSRRLQVLLGHVAVDALVDGDRVRAVTLRDPASGVERVVLADWVLDATETGELLPLCGAEYVTGFESREQTGEPHGPAVAQPLNMQPVSACFALDHLEARTTGSSGPRSTRPGRRGVAAAGPRASSAFWSRTPGRAEWCHERSARTRRATPPRSPPISPTPSWTATSGCSAGSRRDATSWTAATAATLRS